MYILIKQALPLKLLLQSQNRLNINNIWHKTPESFRHMVQ